ncbi:MAG: caspase family protein [Paracoccaceae bacterium]
MIPRLLTILVAALLVALPARAASPEPLDDNARSVAVVIGNRDYRQTVPVDYAHADAEAMRDYLVATLGFREENVFLLLDGTLSEMTQMFGSRRRPRSGRLWRSVEPGRSNVFVYYSGHGVPDLETREPFMLPADGDPNAPDSGYALDLLYANLELVKDRIGPERALVVMIDACFTGETGREGESLLAVSAPGFQPAQPKTGPGIVRLVATSGATPANWDEGKGLGLFTSRFLMGAAGLARPEGAAPDAPVAWSDLSAWLAETVPAAALRETGRRQVPEVDPAALALPAGEPVPAVAEAVAAARDERAWTRARAEGRAAMEHYVATCGACAHRDEALALLTGRRRADAAARDREAWARFSAAGDYAGYLDGCGRICAYRDVARAYVGPRNPLAAGGRARASATADTRPDTPARNPLAMARRRTTMPAGDRVSAADRATARCDALAASPTDPDKPAGVEGRAFAAIDGRAAREACAAAIEAHPGERRLAYQLGRAHDRLGDYAAAHRLYGRAADLGSAAALNGLGALTENGEGVAPSPERAFALYTRAAEAGDVVAMSNLARMLEHGRGTARDVAAAVRWYERAAEAGDAPSLTRLVPYYLEGGPGIAPDPGRGVALFEKAVEAGDASAMATVAVLIDNGFARHFPGRDADELVLAALATGEAGAAAVTGTAMGPMRLAPGTVRAVQRALGREGFYTGEADGAFNPVFVRALDTYARSAASRPAGE